MTRRLSEPELVEVVAAASAVWAGVGLLVWSSVGIVAAVVLHRRGHHLRSLLGVAVVFGPLFIPLALHYTRSREPQARAIEVATTSGGRGSNVVVVVLGDGHEAADAVSVLTEHGPVGTVTVVTMIDFQTADRPADDPVRLEAERRLAAAATLLSDPPAGRVLLPGLLAPALGQFVGDDHDLVVVTGADDDFDADHLSDAVGVPVVVAPSTARRR